jgi:hypothetical protein
MRKRNARKSGRRSVLRFVAIYFRGPPGGPERQVKPWSQKTEPSTCADPPNQTYNDVVPRVHRARRNMAEVGRFRSEVMCGKQDRKPTIRFNPSNDQPKLADSQTSQLA